jgi:hypothetical protein
MTSPEDQALELAKESVNVVLSPVADIIRSLFGPAATEIGIFWGDSVKEWRRKKSDRVIIETAETAALAGLRLNPVAPRLLFPILEAASLQDDEDLHRRWVALLTNAATNNVEVLPCFPEILGQLTSQEAQFLDRAYIEEATSNQVKELQLNHPDLDVLRGFATVYGLSGKLISSLEPLLIENLERLMLVTRIKTKLTVNDEPVHTSPHANHLYITELGKRFVEVCRVPTPIE